jgi:hypothetical protein
MRKIESVILVILIAFALLNIIHAQTNDLRLEILLDKHEYNIGETVQIKIALYNYGKEYVELQFNSSLIFDFEIIGNNGYKYKYSENNVFLQTITKIKIKPNEKFEQNFEWKAEKEGIYTIKAYLVGYNLTAETKIIVFPQIYTPPSHITSSIFVQVNTDKPYYYEGEMVKINVNIINLLRNKIEIKSEEINVYLTSLFGDFKQKLEVQRDTQYIEPYSQSTILIEVANLKQNIYFIEVAIPTFDAFAYNYFVVKQIEDKKEKYSLKINIQEALKETIYLVINKELSLEKLLIDIFGSDLSGSINFVISNNQLNSITMKIKEGEYVILAITNIERGQITDESLAGYSYVNLNSDLEIQIPLKKVGEYENKVYNLKVIYENGTLAKDFSVLILNPIDMYGKYFDNRILTKKYPFFVIVYKTSITPIVYKTSAANIETKADYTETYIGMSFVLPENDEIVIVIKKANTAFSLSYLPLELYTLLYLYLPSTYTPISTLPIITTETFTTTEIGRMQTTYTPVPTPPATYTEITSPTYTSPESFLPATEKTSGREIPSKEIINLMIIIILSTLIASAVYLYIRKIREASF